MEIPPTESSTSKNKRIAKNTLLLYARSLCTMVISLFTSRLTLEALGVDNFGVYNVVGGLVGLFSIISGTITNSISRFLTYGLGKQDPKQLRILFSTSVNIQLALCVIIILFGETIGLWFVTQKLNIPSESIYAAHWVFQCSILTFCVGLLSAPYNACIIAHEKMGIFAYMTIFDVVLKLIFVCLLFITPFNVLITYAVALMLISLMGRIIYGAYCIRHFEECHYQRIFDKSIFKEMATFAGWSFFGNTTYIVNTQGINMIINIFFGVTLNATRGIVSQVDVAVLTLINSFTTAFTPQIIKSYAEGNIPYFNSLITRGTKFTIFLFILIVIPLEIEAPYVLHLWLKEIPPYSVLFLRLWLICSCISQMGVSSNTAIMATGKIKKYQITITFVGCLVFPLSLIAYYFGAPPEATYLFFIPIYIIILYLKMIFMKSLFGLSLHTYIKKAVLPIFNVSILAIPLPMALAIFMPDGLLELILVILTSLLTTSATIYLFGLDRNERILISTKINSFVQRRCNLDKGHLR